MTKVDVSEYPLSTALKNFSQKLPAEYRLELYELAESFLHVGASDGMLTGMEIDNDLDAWKVYFSRMKKELAVPTKT
jgi:hypothetical protein